MIREFSIRRALPSDAPKVIALIDAVGAEGIWLATERYVPTPQWELVLHHPDAEQRVLLLVAEAQKQIVGWCRIFPWSFGNKSNHVGDVGIGVAKEFRKRGIGTALLMQVVTWALQQGYEKLTLDLYATNKDAIRLFQDFGFKRVGVLERHAKIQGLYVDAILMERQLKTNYKD